MLIHSLEIYCESWVTVPFNVNQSIIGVAYLFQFLTRSTAHQHAIEPHFMSHSQTFTQKKIINVDVGRRNAKIKFQRNFLFFHKFLMDSSVSLSFSFPRVSRSIVKERQRKLKVSMDRAWLMKAKRNVTHFNRICIMFQNVVCLIPLDSIHAAPGPHVIMQLNLKASSLPLAYVCQSFFFGKYSGLLFSRSHHWKSVDSISSWNVCAKRRRRRRLRAIVANEINEQFPFARKISFKII